MIAIEISTIKLIKRKIPERPATVLSTLSSATEITTVPSPDGSGLAIARISGSPLAPGIVKGRPLSESTFLGVSFLNSFRSMELANSPPIRPTMFPETSRSVTAVVVGTASKGRSGRKPYTSLSSSKFSVSIPARSRRNIEVLTTSFN